MTTILPSCSSSTSMTPTPIHSLDATRSLASISNVTIPRENLLFSQIRSFDTPQPRIITFTKNGITYHASIFPLPPNVQYKARVIILHNPGEDVILYSKLIHHLSHLGYECFFYQMLNDYLNEDQLVRELNRIIKMCVDDLDHIPNLPNYKVHLLGNFLTGTLALLYGIQGVFKYRIKSVISINPLIKPQHTFNFNLVNYCNLSVQAKINPSIVKNLHLDRKYITRDPNWADLLEIRNPQIDKLNVKQYIYFLKSFFNLPRFEKPTRAIRNTFIIQSNTNPFINSSMVDTEKFVKKISPYIDENCDLKLYDFKEQGIQTGVNLFIERDEVFKRVVGDVVEWLDNN